MGHVVRTGGRKMHKGCWCDKLKEREHREALGIGGYKILKLIFIFYALHCNIAIQRNATKFSFSELLFQFVISSTCFIFRAP
jgi:hypothetical protein